MIRNLRKMRPLTKKNVSTLLKTIEAREPKRIEIADEVFDMFSGGTINNTEVYLHGESVCSVLIRTPYLEEIFAKLIQVSEDINSSVRKVVILNDLSDNDNGIFEDKWVLTSAYFYQLATIFLKENSHKEELQAYMERIGVV